MNEDEKVLNAAARQSTCMWCVTSGSSSCMLTWIYANEDEKVLNAAARQSTCGAVPVVVADACYQG